jgi:hypothetical protein
LNKGKIAKVYLNKKEDAKKASQRGNLKDASAVYILITINLTEYENSYPGFSIFYIINISFGTGSYV